MDVGNLEIKAVELDSVEVNKEDGTTFLNLKYLCKDQFGTQYIYEIPKVNISSHFEIDDTCSSVGVSYSKQILHTTELNRDVNIIFDVERGSNENYYTLKLK